MPVKQREQVTLVRMESTGNRRSSFFLAEAGRFPLGGTSQNREIRVRICERLGVKFPDSAVGNPYLGIISGLPVIRPESDGSCGP
jgi:hypothetical protein